MNTTFTPDVAGFRRQVERKAAAFGVSLKEAYITEGRLLAKEVIERTPPYSGKAIKKILASQGRTVSATIEDLSAKKIGERRLEKGIRKTILGMKNTASSPPESQSLVRSDTPEWGVKTRVQGKEAIRIYVRADGTVHGIEAEKFKPQATYYDLAQHHKIARKKRRQGTTSGSGELVVGRWRWVDKLVTSESAVASYVKEKTKMVGQAKGGWADGFVKLGGKAPGWIGRHRKSGSSIVKTGDKIHIELTNKSEWAKGGDEKGIIQQSLAGRERSLRANITRAAKGGWLKK